MLSLPCSAWNVLTDLHSWRVDGGGSDMMVAVVAVVGSDGDGGDQVSLGLISFASEICVCLCARVSVSLGRCQTRFLSNTAVTLLLHINQ